MSLWALGLRHGSLPPTVRGLISCVGQVHGAIRGGGVPSEYLP